MNTGPLDRRVIIEQKIVTQDSIFGTDVINWIPLMTVWGNVMDVRPSREESVTDGALSMRATRSKIIVRWNKNITADCRIRLNYPSERTLQIIGGPVEIGGRRAFMEMMCEEYSS